MKRLFVFIGILLFGGLVGGNARAESNQIVNNGTLTTAVNFLSTSCTYNWVNTAPDIGLPAKGTGNIQAFIALNTGTMPIVATITATPVGNCPPITFTITVNPTIPTITVTPALLNVNTTYGHASSSEKFVMAGVNLKSGVVVTSPLGFELSTDNATFGDLVSLNSDNADLSYINLNPDVLRMSTTGLGDVNYNAAVANSVQSIRVNPVAASSSSAIKVNGADVHSDDLSAPIALMPGANTIDINVTAQNGTTTKRYTINITRAGSSDATLSALTTDQGTISPIFAPGVNSYTTTVFTNTVVIKPTTTNNGATVKINGLVVLSGASSASIPLNNGNNAIPVVVTAQDGLTTRTYMLNIISTKSSNAGLSALSITPSYALNGISGTTNFFTAVSSSVTSVQQTAVASDANATVKVNGVLVASGAMSNPIQLNATGTTVITTVITAQDGTTTQTYTLSITKNSSSNTVLSRIALSPFARLTPVPNQNNFTTSVGPTLTSIHAWAVPLDENASLKINGTSLAAGAFSPAIPLNAVGTTNIAIVVTAADGVTQRTYNITVSKNGGTNAFINSINLTIPATIVQVLGTNNYTTSVSPQTTTVQQLITANDPNATIKVNGVTTASGTASAPIPLNATGVTNIVTVVTSQNGAVVQNYLLTISKNGASNTAVSQIVLNPGATITRVGNTDNYTTSVAADVNSVLQTIIPADANATIRINGTMVASGVESAPIQLNTTGTTAITAVVTAQDGVTKRTVTLTVSKNGSTNTGITDVSMAPASKLTLVAGSLNNYTTSVLPTVANVQLTVKPADAGATVKINGVQVTAGMPSEDILLNTTGTTLITTVITAPDGISTRTYTVRVSKNGSTDTDIDQLYLTPSAVLTPVVGTNNFTASVGAAVNSVRQIIIPNDSHAKITINGLPVAVGVASNTIALNATGGTNITTVITAQDGVTTKTYITTITRGSNGELLSPLTSDLPPTPVYIRLAATTDAGRYNGNVVLKSNEAEDVFVAMKDCEVAPAPLTIATNKINKNYGVALPDEPASVKYTLTGTLKNGNTINAVHLSYGDAGPANATAGNYTAAVVPSAAAGGHGFLSSNYNIAYVKANAIIVPVKLSIKADNQIKDFGTDNPPLTITYIGFVNGEDASYLVDAPKISTTALARSVVGKYPITIGGAVSPNYVISYMQGTLTVSDAHLAIFIPNAITPNGDGINDSWNIRDVDAYPNTIIEIFNRQGQKVFYSSGYLKSWDGTFRGTQLPSGTYYYFIKNDAKTISGNIALIR